MGFLDLRLNLKTFKLQRLLKRGGRVEKSKSANGRRPSWMMPVSHGYHVVEDSSHDAALRELELELEPDKVVVQREQLEENELWFFGVFDARIGDGVSRYIQAHLFDKRLRESHMGRKSKETMRKAHLHVRAKIREVEKPETWKLSSAAAIVINGEKLVVANMGKYKAVLCKDGKAYQINRGQGVRRRWLQKFIPGMENFSFKFGFLC